ncbi:MAG: hydroxyacid dehydrogenase [Spirochaetes bacterium]|nr:MAG: hydroxyacid dehydrogenase [Spirochaetota bacterium]
MLILISDAFDPSLKDKLSEFGEVTEDKSRLKDAEIVLVRSKTKCTKDYIDGAPNLKVIIRGGVGTDNIDKEYARSKNIRVYNTPRASAIAVAELTFALMLAVPNRLIEGHNSMKDGKWLKKELKRNELYGKTLCLVGMGNIATEVAKRAKAFGMKVVAYRKSGKPSEWAEVKNTLSEAVEDAEYVSLHTPLTDETRGMINKSVIDKMKDGVVLVNTSRGDCIVAEDVVSALNSGKLRAYATDVWPSDPPPGEYPVLKAPNVVMTPHIGASSEENLLRIGDEVYNLIGEYTKGGNL